MRIAVIGTSKIAQEFAGAVSECRDLELTAVYSRSEDNAERFAGAFNIPHKFTDLDALAGSPLADAVYIASPNALHAPQSVLMLKNGKHVLCEKPIATSAAEFAQMLSVAEENGLVLLEACKDMFAPGIGILKGLFPEIGAIRRASLIKNQYSSRYDEFKSGATHNVFTTQMAGGALMDLGIYCVELMVALFGKPESVVSSSIFLHTGVDGQGAVIAKYDGFLAELSYSKISDAVTTSVIQGEEGSLIFENASHIYSIEVVMRNGDRRQVEVGLMDKFMVYEVLAFAEMIAGQRQAGPYNEYSMIAQVIMDEIKRQR